MDQCHTYIGNKDLNCSIMFALVFCTKIIRAAPWQNCICRFETHNLLLFWIKYTVGIWKLNKSGIRAVERSWMPNGLVFECNLNTRQMDANLFSYELVRYLNGRSSTLNTNYLNTKTFEIKRVWCSNDYSIQMVGIQIPTVLIASILHRDSPPFGLEDG